MCLLGLLTFILISSFTVHTAYATSENKTINNNFTSLQVELTDNVTYDGSALENMVMKIIEPVIQISANTSYNWIGAENSKNSFSKQKNATNTYNLTSPTFNSNQAQAKFREIQSIPYNEKTMNCSTKSLLFANYLYENGGKQIKLVVIEHNSGNYSHEFVEWNGHYYDPCNTELSYTLSESAYLNQLHQLGFNGLMEVSPYPN